MTSIEILQCRVDAVDRDAAMARIIMYANGQPGSLVVTLGVEMVMAAQHDGVFRSIINAAQLVVCDTIGLLFVSRVRRGPLTARVTGVELVADLAACSAQRHDLRLYFLGGSGSVAQQAAQALQRRFPGAAIVGARNGYFDESDSASIAATIAATGANVLCVGLGSPKQEKWLARYGAATRCGVGIGVGGSFDVWAGTVRRAPRVVRAVGLEWAYRLAREPRRWRRQLALPRFALAATRELLRVGRVAR